MEERVISNLAQLANKATINCLCENLNRSAALRRISEDLDLLAAAGVVKSFTITCFKLTVVSDEGTLVVDLSGEYAHSYLVSYKEHGVD